MIIRNHDLSRTHARIEADLLYIKGSSYIYDSFVLTFICLFQLQLILLIKMNIL